MKVGDKVKGKVVVMADYGAFIEIAPGVEGLIHVSEMSWSQHLRSAQDFMKVGDEVEAVVLTLDREERKMSDVYKRQARACSVCAKVASWKSKSTFLICSARDGR